MAPTPDRVDDSVLDDLRHRLRATRSVPLVGPSGWERGTAAAYLTELVAYWSDGYDWRVHEDRLRALPWVATGEAGSRGMRAVRQRGDGPTVVLLHGWPDSFFRFDRVLPLLDDLDVVIPCLPGYPWAMNVATVNQAAWPEGNRVALPPSFRGVVGVSSPCFTGPYGYRQKRLPHPPPSISVERPPILISPAILIGWARNATPRKPWFASLSRCSFSCARESVSACIPGSYLSLLSRPLPVA